ncbi:hypothetical protein [Xanthobacter flavus]|uniref:hypothetical protein n=1 Tax=Xanthobacter flavus TaxID=281 RepID=UPI001AE3688B|nr:hypothetical protein [Xanthobacter flavus]MBP2147387.1 multidrug resistance efflux pump [Xanthobacter flavus]
MSDVETDTRDRVIRLETQMEHMEKTLANMSTKVDSMHALLQQARGARWFLVGIAMVIGAAGGFLVKLGTIVGWPVR